MDVFISWSGERSRAAAEALRDWLPMVINAARPFLSAADLDKGTRWASELALRLEAAKVGIICLTPTNLDSRWILFEAGALSKTLENTFVCPLLIDLEPVDIKGPLAQFQLTRITRDDIFRLLQTINKAPGEQALETAHLEKAFDVWWPKLESQLKVLPAEDSDAKPHRPDRELLEEILTLVRGQSRSQEAASFILGPNTQRIGELSSTQIIQKVQEAIESTGIEIESGQVMRPEGKFVARMKTKEGVINITLPEDAPANAIELMTALQVRRHAST